MDNEVVDFLWTINPVFMQADEMDIYNLKGTALQICFIRFHLFGSYLGIPDLSIPEHLFSPVYP